MVKVLSASALIVSCAALALVAIRPAARPAPVTAPSEQNAQLTGTSSMEVEELDLRLRALEDNLAHLGRRLMQVEAAARQGGGVQPSAGTAVAAGAVDVASELRALRADLNSVATTEALASDRGREILKTAMRDLQSELQADRVREFRERQAQERDARFNELVQNARLTGTQERDLRALLDAETAKRDELTERIRGGERDRSLFRELRTLRQQNDEQAQSLLSADQYEAWSQMRREERGRGPRRGGGR